MIVQNRGESTIVVYPFPGSPAFDAGLQRGDSIVVVDDRTTTGLDTTQVADLLKGHPGTPVQVTVERPGVPERKVFEVIRDSIPRKSVEYAFFLQPGIAYLRIEQFNENTSSEMDAELRRMGEEGIDGLVLDLRGNPGGLLNEGVAVAGRFLERGQTVVKHRGRSSPERTYDATRGNRGDDYPVVVLVDRASASAAEIVAGALQDHDRAWIMGDKTFGKGLVQTVYPLTENTGLALTTARYYTPSGRLIQRDYANRSFFEYYYRKDEDERNLLDVKMTDAGRAVYGGDGITPDEMLTPDELNSFQQGVLRNSAFFSFSAEYFGRNPDALPEGWTPSEEIIEQFHRHLLDEGVEFTEAEFTENHDWVKQTLRREMYITGFDYHRSQRLAIETDPIVIAAIEALPKAQQLLDDAKEMIAARRNGTSDSN
jgi:carboxyl-terminal processing protease